MASKKERREMEKVKAKKELAEVKRDVGRRPWKHTRPR